MNDLLSKGRLEKGYLNGHFLIAMPGMEDRRFARSVIYVCAHSAEGAMGLIINQPAREFGFAELLTRLGLQPPQKGVPADKKNLRVRRGGPLETGRGFVLHSADYFAPSATLPIDADISLTATLDVLSAMATGVGPREAMLALGYSSWIPGQLENEIHANDWLSSKAVPELIFDEDLDTKYDRALACLGIDPAYLSSSAGHA